MKSALLCGVCAVCSVVSMLIAWNCSQTQGNMQALERQVFGDDDTEYSTWLKRQGELEEKIDKHAWWLQNVESNFRAVRQDIGKLSQQRLSPQVAAHVMALEARVQLLEAASTSDEDFVRYLPGLSEDEARDALKRLRDVRERVRAAEKEMK